MHTRDSRSKTCRVALAVTAGLLLLSLAELIGTQAMAADPGPHSHLLGSWGGARAALKKDGIRIGLSYAGEFAYDVAGGKRRGGTYVQQTLVKLGLKLGKLTGLSGSSAHIALLNRAGRNASAGFVGDHLLRAQELYGGGGGVVVHLGYAYLEEKARGGRLRLKAGRLPVMTDFGTLRDGCDFMALALCADRGLGANIGWTVLPRATWGGSIVFHRTRGVVLGTGAYEVNPNTGGRSGFDWSLKGATGAMVPVEIDLKPKVGRNRLPGDYKFGVWVDTARFPEWDTAFNDAPLYTTAAPAARRVRMGAYLLAQQRITSTMTALAGYAYSGAHTALFEHFAFIGVLDRGRRWGRPHDRAGLSLTYARVSTDLTGRQRGEAALGMPLRNGAPGIQTDELLIEANYDIAAIRGVDLMPDLQYVIRPDATNAYPDALVAGIQVRVKF